MAATPTTATSRFWHPFADMGAVSRQELVEDLGGGIAEAQERAVDVQITRLRRKIEEDPKAPRYLQTVRGSGYMLAPD